MEGKGGHPRKHAHRRLCSLGGGASVIVAMPFSPPSLWRLSVCVFECTCLTTSQTVKGGNRFAVTPCKTFGSPLALPLAGRSPLSGSAHGAWTSDPHVGASNIPTRWIPKGALNHGGGPRLSAEHTCFPSSCLRSGSLLSEECQLRVLRAEAALDAAARGLSSTIIHLYTPPPPPPPLSLLS